MKTVTFPVKGLNFAGCAREIEKRLDQLAGISQAEASYVTQTATVTFEENLVDEAKLRELIRDCGFACGAPVSLARGAVVDHHAAHQHHGMKEGGAVAIKTEEKPPARKTIPETPDLHQDHAHHPGMERAAHPMQGACAGYHNHPALSKSLNRK